MQKERIEFEVKANLIKIYHPCRLPLFKARLRDATASSIYLGEVGFKGYDDAMNKALEVSKKELKYLSKNFLLKISAISNQELRNRYIRFIIKSL